MQAVSELCERLAKESSILRFMILCLLAALFGGAEVAWAGSELMERPPSETVENALEVDLDHALDVPELAAVQSASSDQGAGAASLAIQKSPTNASFVVRLLSPGDDEALHQATANGADATSANETSIGQSAEQDQVATGDATGGPKQYQPGDITQNQAENAPLEGEIAQSSTQSQSASADAVALQLTPANIYVSIRVLSPGDTGPVIQLIGNSAGSLATNAVETQQLAESQQESGPDPLPVEYDTPAEPTPSNPEPAGPTDVEGSSGDTHEDELATQDPPATSDQPEGLKTELGIPPLDSPTEDIEQYYVEPDQYQKLIPDLALDLDPEVVLDHQLEMAIDIEKLLAWIWSSNWESVAGQVIDLMPESDSAALMTEVDGPVDELLHELELPPVVPVETVESPSQAVEKQQFTDDKAGDSEPARRGPQRERSLVVKPGTAEVSATSGTSSGSERGSTKERASQAVASTLAEQSIVLVGAGSQTAESGPSVFALARIGLPQFPSDLLSYGASPGAGGPASPQAVLPAAVLGLGAFGLFLFLQLVFSVWRARGLVLPLERPG